MPDAIYRLCIYFVLLFSHTQGLMSCTPIQATHPLDQEYIYANNPGANQVGVTAYSLQPNTTPRGILSAGPSVVGRVVGC